MSLILKNLQEALASPSVEAQAASRLARVQALGISSDWRHPEKELDFARVVAAAHHVLPPGGSIETGVLAGGTSSVLILSCAPEAFHVSIDPYGLPGQSYWGSKDDKGDASEVWPLARTTMRRLHELAEEQRVSYSHFLMGSEEFARSDLLRHPGRFNVVHLDGDHSFPAVAAELTYFTRRLRHPAVFVMDDHDGANPGVGRALEGFSDTLTQLFRNEYDLREEGRFGFSAWFYPGVDALSVPDAGVASRIGAGLRQLRDQSGRR